MGFGAPAPLPMDIISVRNDLSPRVLHLLKAGQDNSAICIKIKGACLKARPRYDVVDISFADLFDRQNCAIYYSAAVVCDMERNLAQAHFNRGIVGEFRSEEHTSALQSLMRI